MDGKAFYVGHLQREPCTPQRRPHVSIPTPQPVRYRPQFASFGKSVRRSSITFISQLAFEKKMHERFGLEKIASLVHSIRKVKKKHMVHKGYTPKKCR
jgi:urease subunit alpha